MMDHFARKNAIALRNNLASMVIDHFLPSLVIWMGNDWVLPILDEGSEFSIEVDNVFVGPV